ncbi:hypothetical protein GCM10027258_79410 [Amycolatopsis stemonae]
MRDTIIAVAADLFAERGADDVGFDEIAATAGISARHLRVYFTSTTAIRAAVDAHAGEHEQEEADGAGAQLVA